MRRAATRVLSLAVGATLALVACDGACGRSRQGKHDRRGAPGAGPTTGLLDYAPFLKAGSDAVVAAFARHLAVAPPRLLERGGEAARDGGGDRDVYAVGNGGRIELRFDRRRQPLALQYRAPAGCLSSRGLGQKPVAPTEANASVLSLLRRMELTIDDTVRVESQLHDDGRVWIGVYVWQTYRGERIERPSVFALIDAITNRICEMRLPRWYLGLDALGPPLGQDALAARARAAGAGLAAGQPPGAPVLRSLRIVGDTLCREVKLAGSPELTFCMDVVGGQPMPEPW